MPPIQIASQWTKHKMKLRMLNSFWSSLINRKCRAVHSVEREGVKPIMEIAHAGSECLPILNKRKNLIYFRLPPTTRKPLFVFKDEKSLGRKESTVDRVP